ncbi:hypothetical protein Bbelb_425660 [Branchiostoma belcheri]|nr:hypothetical protein Bbelb_425660 [Branchiostoma belcheri]
MDGKVPPDFEQEKHLDAGRRHGAERAPAVRVTIKCSFTAPCRGAETAGFCQVPGQSPVLTSAGCGRVSTGSLHSGQAATRLPWRGLGAILAGPKLVRPWLLWPLATLHQTQVTVAVNTSIMLDSVRLTALVRRSGATELSRQRHDASR